MKIKLLVLVTMVLSVTAYGSKNIPNALPENGQKTLKGTWIVDSTVIKQTVDSVSTVKTYLPGDTAKTFVRRPTKIVVTDSEISFEHTNHIESGTYSLNDNKLQVNYPTHRAEYKIEFVDNDKVKIFYSVRYMIDGVHNAEEQCQFNAKISTN